MTVVTFDLETYAEIPHVLLQKLEARVVAENPLPDLETALSFVRAARNIKDPFKARADIEKRKERVREEQIEHVAKVDAKKAAIFDKAAISPLTSRVVYAGIGILHGGKEWEYKGMLAKRPEDEKSVLEWLDTVLGNHAPQCLVTFNGRLFDVPFAVARMAVNNVNALYRWPDYKYDKRHCDLLEHYQGKQDYWSALLTGEGKGAQGSSIAEMVQAEDWDGVEAHGMEDVKLNALMYDRLCRVLKNLPKGDY